LLIQKKDGICPNQARYGDQIIKLTWLDGIQN